MTAEMRPLPDDEWCESDDCPASICGGPHYDIVTDFGIETLKKDQKPIGKPVELPPEPPHPWDEWKYSVVYCMKQTGIGVRLFQFYEDAVDFITRSKTITIWKIYGPEPESGWSDV